ncbi:MAG: hypothetical protein K6B52_00175 [Clostridiales bacterium]|nr:hypothetical protein [Clostridiales bacterium]
MAVDIDLRDLMSKEELLDRVNKMNALGPRFTGNSAHNAFIEKIKKEIEEMGLPVFEDKKTFFRWEEKCSSLVIHSENGDIPIPVSSAYPYSGFTGEDGVRGRLEIIVDKRLGFLTHARDKICVCRVSNLEVPTILVEDRRSSKPEDTDLPRHYGGPVITTFANFPLLKVAKMSGAKAVVCIWSGFSDESVQGQYLPFILDYQGMPAVWVNPSQGKKLIKAAKQGCEATLTLTAETQNDAPTKTIYSVIKGEDKRECIIINTHTDGVNCVEENGPIALLSMMRYFKTHRPRRNMIFVFMTGHFRLPALKAPGAIQCTSRWLEDHKELWDGEEGHLYAVGALTLEHLGCKEYSDTVSHTAYVYSNPIDIEMCYTSNEAVDRIYYKALEGREKVRTVTYRGCNALHFGEGQPLFDVGIPTIALVPGPGWLCVVDKENSCMDKFDPELMELQTQTFTKAAVIMDETPAHELGRADGYSFGIIKKVGISETIKNAADDIEHIKEDIAEKIEEIREKL